MLLLFYNIDNMYIQIYTHMYFVLKVNKVYQAFLFTRTPQDYFDHPILKFPPYSETNQLLTFY